MDEFWCGHCAKFKSIENMAFYKKAGKSCCKYCADKVKIVMGKKKKYSNKNYVSDRKCNELIKHLTQYD